MPKPANTERYFGIETKHERCRVLHVEKGSRNEWVDWSHRCIAGALGMLRPDGFWHGWDRRMSSQDLRKSLVFVICKWSDTWHMQSFTWGLVMRLKRMKQAVSPLPCSVLVTRVCLNSHTALYRQILHTHGEWISFVLCSIVVYSDSRKHSLVLTMCFVKMSLRRRKWGENCLYMCRYLMQSTVWATFFWIFQHALRMTHE